MPPSFIPASKEYSHQNVPSMTRVAAGAFGFLTLIHVLDGPERYGAFSFFETIPSSWLFSFFLNRQGVCKYD